MAHATTAVDDIEVARFSGSKTKDPLWAEKPVTDCQLSI
jgi:hypothetical protein